MSRVGGDGRWPPQRLCFVPRLGDYLARLEHASLASLLARPAALARALRWASELLGLRVECLDVPAAWILHAAGWPAAFAEHGIEIGPPPAEAPAAHETAERGPLLAVRDALRALPASTSAPATLISLPSPATLASAAGAGHEEWSRAVLQALIRSLGQIDVLSGVMFDDDDGILALGRLLDHFQLTPICVRRPSDNRPPPPGALVARAVTLDALANRSPEIAGVASEMLATTDGPVSPNVAPEDLLRASRRVAGVD